MKEEVEEVKGPTGTVGHVAKCDKCKRVERSTPTETKSQFTQSLKLAGWRWKSGWTCWRCLECR